MEVMEFTDKDKKVITISLPLEENYKIQIYEDRVIFRKVRSLAEVSEDIQKYLKKDYSDQEINDLVEKARKELWTCDKWINRLVNNILYPEIENLKSKIEIAWPEN